MEVKLAEWKASRKQKRLVNQVLRSGRLTYGDKTRELERRFADIHGAKHAIFTSSGTAALKISLHALKDKHGWPDGSEVIIPSVTFVATMNAVLMNNLKPVLVDVRVETANLDPKLLSRALTKKTVAILPVHLLGQPADMEAIMKFAKRHKLEVIEDSCETMFVNQLQGTTACFSTYVAHLMVTGVGGLLLTNDSALESEMRSMLFHGRDPSYLTIDDKPQDIWRRFHFPRLGYSDRLTELEAALGIGELDNWRKMILKRQNNARFIAKYFDGWKDVIVPVEDYSRHSFMFFPMYVEKRDELMIYLENRGIQTRTMMPLTSQPTAKKVFGDDVEGKFPVAKWINERGLLIGCHQYLNNKDLKHIIKTITDFYVN